MWIDRLLPWLGRKAANIHMVQENLGTASIPAPERLPVHVAIIMDGNGRWAEARGLPRSVGHRQGTESLKEIVKACGEWGIPILTVYAFSTENWRRPQEEVDFLMDLLAEVLRNELETLHKEGVRIVPIGRLDDLPKQVRSKVDEAARLTADNLSLKLNMAISYGGRLEIVDAVQKLLTKAATGEPVIADEELLSQCLYTAGDPDPDLIIRTGGERRLSNFLLWQSAYAELYFSDVMWPDFTPDHLRQALVEYGKRDRRFGGIRRK